MSQSATGAAATPKHLWIIGIIALLWNMVGPYDYLMTQTKNASYMAKFTPEQLEYFYGFPTWVIGTWATAVWTGLLGSILLLLRRKLAGPVFIISFIAMLATTIHNYGFSDGYEVMGGAGAAVFSAVIFLVALGLVLYTRAMCNRGVLR